MEPTVRAIECVNEPEPVPGSGVKASGWEWKVEGKEEDGPASITTEPGRICNHEVIKAISAR